MESPIDVQLRGVTKRYGEVLAVDGVNLEVHDGEFFSLLGPSGCGKTTSLRIMAGFERPDAGVVSLRGVDVTMLPPHKRDVNTVFQNYELFPHLNVFDNVAYGLRMARVASSEIEPRVDEMLEIVRLPEHRRRFPRELSGGQQQRVALARALVNRPAALLLDEPLSALDVKLRVQMQHELRLLQARLGTTFIYVTHDQEEAMVMSDRVAVMDRGRVLQVGTPLEIYENPSSAFVADFIGSLNAIQVGERSGERVEAPERTPDSSRVAIRPERIALAAVTDPEPLAGMSFVRGQVRMVDFRGSTWRVEIEREEGTMSVVTVNDGGAIAWSEGDSIRATWPTSAAMAMPE